MLPNVTLRELKLCSNQGQHFMALGMVEHFEIVSYDLALRFGESEMEGRILELEEGMIANC
jgi:hypothetical protein